MEIDKIKQWMDAAQQIQTDTFWSHIFENDKKSTSSLTPTTITEFIPKCDLYETESNLIAEIEVPGIPKEKLHILIQTQILTVTGEFRTLEQNRKYFLKERANRKFKKEITLPYPIMGKTVKTDWNNGILFIIMPINQEEMEDIPITYHSSHPE